MRAAINESCMLMKHLEQQIPPQWFQFACYCSGHPISARCTSSFGMWMRCFPLGRVNSDQLRDIQSIASYINLCAESYWTSSCLVQGACISLFTVAYGALALCFTIAASSSQSSSIPGNSHIIGSLWSSAESNPSVAVTRSLNTSLTFIAICLQTQLVVWYWSDSSKIPKLHAHFDRCRLCNGFALDVQVSHETRWIIHPFSSICILVFRFSCVRFTFSTCNTFTILKLVSNVILLMTLLNVSATAGIVTTKIGSRADLSAGCWRGGVV